MRHLNSSCRHHLGQMDSPASQTCGWLASHITWLEWQALGDPALLCITADVGRGKSVMAKHGREPDEDKTMRLRDLIQNLEAETAGVYGLRHTDTACC